MLFLGERENGDDFQQQDRDIQGIMLGNLHEIIIFFYLILFVDSRFEQSNEPNDTVQQLALT